MVRIQSRAVADDNDCATLQLYIVGYRLSGRRRDRYYYSRVQGLNLLLLDYTRKIKVSILLIYMSEKLRTVARTLASVTDVVFLRRRGHALLGTDVEVIFEVLAEAALDGTVDAVFDVLGDCGSESAGKY